MHEPLRAGAASAAARQAAARIRSINPSLAIYVLDAQGRVIGDYTGGNCAQQAQVSLHAIHEVLGSMPMLPWFIDAPCFDQRKVFSAAHIEYGKNQRRGYLLAVFGNSTRMSALTMLRTSSIARTVSLAGAAALVLSSAVGLILFALLTRRFSRLTRAVQRFAAGDSKQRIDVATDDEIGRLADAFNDMAATIEVQLNALHENDRQRRELVANLSHDFRTPLTSLRGYADKLRGFDIIPAATRRSYLDAVMGNVERLTRIAQQLSTLARVDAIDQPLWIEPFSLIELAYDIVGKLGPQAETARVHLEIDAAASADRVAADIALIDRALTNLIDNAIRATGPGGRVRLSARRADQRLRVTVEDTGIGLAAHEIALVTQRFYRTAGSRSRGDGSGLGLAIVQEICERHATRLSIHSVPEQGTQISFDLALA